MNTLTRIISRLAILSVIAVAVTFGQTTTEKSDFLKAKKEHAHAFPSHKNHSTHSAQTKPMISKDSLIAEGKYNCCLKNPCDQCYREEQNCNCYKAVKSDKPVCQECYDGWQKGQGRLEWIDKSEIKVEKSHKH